MALGVSFETVDALPAVPRVGAIYFVKPDGADDFDVVVTDNAGAPVALRKPLLQMAFGSSPSGLLPANAEFGRYLVVEGIELEASLSAAVASSAASVPSIVTVHRGADLVARFTFGPGATVAVPQILIPYVPAGDLLIFRAPLTSDATLAGVTGTLGARRL